MSAADEETALIGGDRVTILPGKKVIRFNIETLRIIGVCGMLSMLIVGGALTTYAVVWPATDEATSTVWDKLFHGAPSDMHREETFIFKLFHFNHSCSVIDFNPAKTVAALVVMFHIAPICLFVVMHYFRVQTETDPRFAMYKTANAILSPFTFVFTLYVYMVFVNSPDRPYGTEEGMTAFRNHYVPYSCWQCGMMIMAFQQCWYLILKDAIPFDAVTGKTLWRYCLFLLIYYIVYTVFVWSFIHGDPLWDTTTDNPIGNTIALAIMWGWNILVLILPAIFSYGGIQNGLGDSVIEFYQVQEQ